MSTETRFTHKTEREKILERGFEAAMRWLYHDTGDLIKAPFMPKPGKLAPEFLDDLRQMRAAYKAVHE